MNTYDTFEHTDLVLILFNRWDNVQWNCCYLTRFIQIHLFCTNLRIIMFFEKHQFEIDKI